MYVLDDLVVATLPNSPVFNCLVSHVIAAFSGAWGALCRAGESGARLPLGGKLVQSPKWMADGAISSATKVGLVAYSC